MSEDGVPHEDLAKRRFFTLQGVRLAGVVMVLLGLIVLNGKLAWPAPVGYFLVITGLFDTLFLPTFLARRWKTPK